MKRGENMAEFFWRAVEESRGLISDKSASKAIALRKFAEGDSTSAFRHLLAALEASKKPVAPIMDELRELFGRKR
ncbi:MAG: hypothetical protein HY791_03095 [Deltaproteobacteria bacterium]|nr:hypothetical protein [Deltaproteobacteria bacterium]